MFSSRPKRQHMFQWVPTDDAQLARAEAKMLLSLHGEYEQLQVATPLCEINTIYHLTKGSTESVVLLHGFAFGLAQWVPNWCAIARHANVFAIDMPGFGRSGRPQVLSGGASESILFFVQTIEEWFKVMAPVLGEKVVLVGHSFGGYIASHYALNYPNRVKALVLVDPFGIQDTSSDAEQPKVSTVAGATANPPAATPAASRAPSKGFKFEPIQGVKRWLAEVVFYHCNPLSVLRGAGPIGPLIMESIGVDRVASWKRHLVDEHALMDYLYHCNTRRASGEEAFVRCVKGMGLGIGGGFSPKRPLLRDIARLSTDIALFFICGAESWINPVASYAAAQARIDYNNAPTPTPVIPPAVSTDAPTNVTAPSHTDANRHEDTNQASENAPAETTPAASAEECPKRPGKKPITEIHILPNCGHHVYVDDVQTFNVTLCTILSDIRIGLAGRFAYPAQAPHESTAPVPDEPPRGDVFALHLHRRELDPLSDHVPPHGMSGN